MSILRSRRRVSSGARATATIPSAAAVAVVRGEVRNDADVGKGSGKEHPDQPLQQEPTRDQPDGGPQDADHQALGHRDPEDPTDRQPEREHGGVLPRSLVHADSGRVERDQQGQQQDGALQHGEDAQDLPDLVTQGVGGA